MKAELKVFPAIVRDLSDDEAIIIMVDANIQREEILPSEKAKAYKMKYDAMKNQGLPGNSLQQISEVSGDNYKAVQRYIWLARLNDDLLELVDKKRLGLVQGVSISSLSQEEQKLLYPLIKVMHCKLSSSQAETIKKMSQERKLTEKTLTDYLEMSQKTTKLRKVTIKSDKLDSFFTEEYTETEITDIIFKLLEEWKSRG